MVDFTTRRHIYSTGAFIVKIKCLRQVPHCQRPAVQQRDIRAHKGQERGVQQDPRGAHQGPHQPPLPRQLDTVRGVQNQPARYRTVPYSTIHFPLSKGL